MTRRALAAATVLVALALTLPLAAQQPARGGPPPTPKAGAAIDLTGYWVSVIVEDWKWRMVTPRKGVVEGVPLNAEGRKVADSWDPARDEAAGEQCRAYGAANIMRLPGRLRIAWENDTTLRIDTDAGSQTRLLHFGGMTPAVATASAPSWQGRSIASWDYGPGRGRGGARLGSLKVVTTQLRPGYVRKNGVPYSGRATMTEYFDVNTLPNGDQWLTVTTKVEDPQFFVRHYLTTSDFKKLPNAAGWAPTPCSAR